MEYNDDSFVGFTHEKAWVIKKQCYYVKFNPDKDYMYWTFNIRKASIYGSEKEAYDVIELQHLVGFEPILIEIREVENG